MTDAFIVDGIRTPIGNIGGVLGDVRPDDLAAHAIASLLARSPTVDPAAVADVILGCANQAGEDNRNVARMALLLAGLPVSVPGETVNRLCASGLSAVASAARGVKVGEGDLYVAGGVESMTRAPYALSKSSAAYGRDMQLFDTSLGWRFVNPKMKAKYGTDSMGETAENVAEQYQVSRADQDAFAMRSQQRATAARASGRFAIEITPVDILQRRGEPKRVEQDEFIRPETTVEVLAKLKPAFRHDGKGSVTAGNSSGLNDGAAALLIASEMGLKQFSLQPKARVVATAAAGVEPRIMGMGPVPATRRVMQLAGLRLEQMDVIELNEAFAAQSLACVRELGIADDDPRVNPNGGAIALGHPLGMSGARLVLTATRELERRGARFALCTMCIGVRAGDGHDLGTDMKRLQNYALGEWVTGTGPAVDLFHAVTGEKIAEATSAGLDFKAMTDYARTVGGPKLRAMTFHERARMLKAMAQYLMERKDSFYAISAATGATKGDSWIDIEGGIGTFFAYSGRGRREFPNETFYVDGATEPLSKGGTFIARHICVPLEGVAVHINAFNFPCWGMLEKLATALLAGVPAIVKPATVTSYLTEAMVRAMVESRILPDGALQLICGSAGDLLSHLGGQDAVAFTGSAVTGRMLKEGPAIANNAVRFNVEADSLNCSILGPDARPGTEEFDLFIKEVVREMTVKAGQKCTAIRRTIVPAGMEEDVVKALRTRLASVTIGDPSVEGVRMGPLVSKGQVRDVAEKASQLRAAGEVVFGGTDDFAVVGADRARGAFFGPILLACDKPFARSEPHDIEAFGPVNTVMPYDGLADAIELAKRGRGSLCGSLFTADPNVAREVVLGVAPYHGRLVVLDRTTAKESTGHGSPLPNLVHGGPGRAGGGEEMGGVRGVLHYMQRTAVQGSPTTLSRVMNQWMTGAAQTHDSVHPFRKHFEELAIGETLVTSTRTITLDDIVSFAQLSGDKFYAHMDDAAARRGIFEGRVAHGYFIVSAAAGLFVDPAADSPVLANYGMENLRFLKPVYPGDTIQVRLTCKQKTAKDTPADGIPQGVVAWDVDVRNQHGESVALYTILTLVRSLRSAT